MTLTIPHTALASALSAASKVVEAKNMLPILAMARLSAIDGALSITTTNLDVEFHQIIPCQGDLAPICVDAKRLAAMASSASKDITMSLEGSILTVKSGRSRWAAPTLVADDFPVMPVDDLCKPMAFDPGPLVKRLLWAAETSPTRPYLSGVYMDRGNLVATNGYVMPIIRGAVKPPKGAPSVILAAGFLKACPDVAGTLEWDAAKARFTAGGVTVTGKMIEGNFPDWERIIPEPCEPYAVGADELIDAIKRVRIASDEQQRKLRVTRGDGVLSVRIEGTSGFEGQEDVEADCSAGFEMGVNADFLVGMLTALDAEAVTIEQSAPNTTMVIRPTVQPAGQTVMGLVWPLRI